MKTKRKPIYELYKIKDNRQEYIVDVNARNSIIIIETNEHEKKIIAGKIFNKSFYEEIDEKIKLLKDIN